MDRYIYIFTVLALLGLPAAARGEESTGAEGDTDESPPEFVQRARTLFGMGVDLVDSGEWDSAAERFEQALALHTAPTIRYNLAAVYVRLERHGEAAEQLQIAIDDEAISPELRTQAEELLSELTPELGRLRLTLDIAEEFGEDVQVLLDGRVLNPEQLARPIWVDPGSHIVTASRESEELARLEVDAAIEGVDGATLVVAAPVDEEPVVEPVADLVGEEEGQERRRQRRPLTRDGRIWVGVGVGLALVISAVVVGVTVGTRDEEVEPPIVGTLGDGVMVWP